MQEIRTGRMKGRKMSGSVSRDRRYAVIMRSVVEESLVRRFRLEPRVVYTSWECLNSKAQKQNGVAYYMASKMTFLLLPILQIVVTNA